MDSIWPKPGKLETPLETGFVAGERQRFPYEKYPGRDSNPQGRIRPGDFKSPVSANSTTWAGAVIYGVFVELEVRLRPSACSMVTNLARMLQQIVGAILAG